MHFSKIARLQSEVLDISAKFQKEVDRLENENKELRRQIILKEQKNSGGSKMKKSLIDMYSEVLDELTIYDSGYNTMVITRSATLTCTLRSRMS